MYYKLIENNISKLNSNMTLNFFRKKNISLTQDDAVFLTNVAKENWIDLYNKRYDEVFSIISKVLGKEKSDRILSVYLETINQYLN